MTAICRARVDVNPSCSVLADPRLPGEEEGAYEDRENIPQRGLTPLRLVP
jgi:hypothetical protein